MQALGTIEVVGLVAGIEAADVACKAANVTLIGYELAKGGGYVTVKVEGQVGAVTAAIDAAEAAAAKLTRVVSRLVIPRPAAGLDALVFSPATVGYTPPEPAATAPEPAGKPAESTPKAAPKTAPANKLLPAADSGVESGASPGRKEPAKPEATRPKPSQRPARAKRASAARNEPAPGPGEPAQQPQGTPPQAPQQTPEETTPAPRKNQQEE